MAFYRHRLRNFEIGPDEATRTVRTALQRSSMTEAEFVSLAETGIRSWVGRNEEDLLELGQRLFVQGIAKSLFHDAWRLVKAHQRKGHTVVDRLVGDPVPGRADGPRARHRPRVVHPAGSRERHPDRQARRPVAVGRRARRPPCGSSPKPTTSTSR